MNEDVANIAGSEAQIKHKGRMVNMIDTSELLCQSVVSPGVAEKISNYFQENNTIEIKEIGIRLIPSRFSCSDRCRLPGKQSVTVEFYMQCFDKVEE